MKDLGWAPALVFTLLAFLLICALGAILGGMWKNWRRQQRRNKRLCGHGNAYSMRDFK
jgi:DNA-binding transcriptional regulator of glucitol operon